MFTPAPALELDDNQRKRLKSLAPSGKTPQKIALRARIILLAVDEKSRIQALDRTAPLLPLRPGIPARQTHDSKRHGTTTLFAALSLLDGKAIGQCLPRRRSQQFASFPGRIDHQTPAELHLHLIVDNSGTHKSPPVKRWLNYKLSHKCGISPTWKGTAWLPRLLRPDALCREAVPQRQPKIRGLSPWGHPATSRWVVSRIYETASSIPAFTCTLPRPAVPGST